VGEKISCAAARFHLILSNIEESQTLQSARFCFPHACL